jgi:hypothetical protein
VNTFSMPLKLWWLVFFLAAGCFFLLNQDWSNFESDSAKSEILNIARLRENRSRYHVVALGNSLLAHGMPFDLEVDEKLSRQKILININRIAISGMDSDYFVSIFPQIIAAKPDLIIIQAEFFILRTPESNFQKNVTKIYGASRNYISGNKSKGGVYERNRFTSPVLKYLQEDCQNRGMPQSEIEKKGMKAYKSVLVGTNHRLDSYLEFISQARAQGIEVVFLEIGRSKVANDLLGRENQVIIDRSLQEISLKTQSEVWRFPANLSLAYYCDLAHMNERGQNVFMQWLSEKLKTKIYSKPNKI